MSDNFPLDIQREIIKHLPAKSLIRFRSVSKQWKSLIHSSTFIADHSVNQARPHHLLITYTDVSSYQEKYVSIVDDDSFPLRKFPHTVPPAVKLASHTLMFDCSHGLVCLHSFGMDRKTLILVIWNPSIRKSVGIMLPYEFHAIGFGVCPRTSDLKIVKMTRDSGNWLAEVLTLSSRAWRSVSWNLPYKSLEFAYSHVVIIDGVIHWQAYDTSTRNYRIISFDLTSEEFGEVDLPDALARPRMVLGPCIYKLNESLAMLNYREDDAWKGACDVWKMLKNGGPKSSFTKLFTVTLNLEDCRIIGFRKNGQLIRQWYRRRGICRRELEVYDPRSEHIIDLGIYGSAFMMTPYTESLLLLNYPDSIILS